MIYQTFFPFGNTFTQDCQKQMKMSNAVSFPFSGSALLNAGLF